MYSSWDTGYAAELHVTNSGAGPVDGWTLSWVMPDGHQIRDLWNGRFVQKEAKVEVTDAGWNAKLPENATAYLGFVAEPSGGLSGSALALLAVFLPGLLLLVGVLPFWDALRTRAQVQGLMRGANAAVVGILGAALYDPVFTGAITGMPQFALALTGFVLLTAWKTPPWIVVALSAAGGVLLALA